MSTSVGTAQLDLGINYRQFNRQLDGISNNAQRRVGGAFKKLGVIIAAAFATKKIFDFGASFVRLGSDLEEVQNVVDVTFGNMSSAVDDFAKTSIRQFGMSQLAAKKFSSTMGAMLKSSGMAGKEVLDMSLGVTGLTADMASFYNLEHEQMFQKIRAGISGETEPLKQLGINMSVANLEAYALSQGITKSFKAMGQAEQVLLRYNYLMSVTGDAQGDFARTSGGWANQTRILNEQWKQVKSTLGQGFINLLLPLVKGLNTFMERLQLAAEYFKEFTRVITGKSKDTEKSASGVVNSAGGMVSSMEDVNEASKEVGKGSLAGFDQLNVIGSETADTIGDIADAMGGEIGPDFGEADKPQVDIGIDTSGMENFVEKLKIIRVVGMEVAEYFKTNFGPMFENMFIGIVDSANKTWPILRDSFIPIGEWFRDNGPTYFQDMSDSIVSILGELGTSIKLIYDDIILGILAPAWNLASTIVVDTLNMILGFWSDHGKKLVDSFVLFIQRITELLMILWTVIIQPIWEKIIDVVTRLWEKHLKGLVSELISFVGELATVLMDVINKFILPMVSAFVDMFGPAITKVINVVLDILGYAIGIIADIITGIIRILRGILEFLVGVFTGDWDKAWAGITKIFDGVKLIFAGIVKGLIDIFKSIIAYLKGDFGINWDGFWIGLKELTRLAWEGIKSVIKVVIDWIMDKVDAIMKRIDQMKQAVKDVVGFGANVSGTIKSAATSVGSGIKSVWQAVTPFANGGLVSAPQLALVGDNKNARNDPEVISPLSKLNDMLGQSNQAVVEVLLMILGTLENQDLSLNIDGEKLARTMRDKLRNEDSRVGKSMVTVGGVRV